MMIYIDDDFRCHVNPADGLRAVEADFFDGKCAEFIEGYRFIPAGETWTRADGAIFTGEIAAPWKPYGELDAVQRRYERAQLDDMRAALDVLEVHVDG